MSQLLKEMIETMVPRLPPLDLDTPIRLDVKGHGSIRIENNDAVISDADAPCVITASAEIFAGILAYKTYPATAMALGKIKVAGDFGPAIKFSYIYNH